MEEKQKSVPAAPAPEVYTQPEQIAALLEDRHGLHDAIVECMIYNEPGKARVTASFYTGHLYVFDFEEVSKFSFSVDLVCRDLYEVVVEPTSQGVEVFFDGLNLEVLAGRLRLAVYEYPPAKEDVCGHGKSKRICDKRV